MESELEHDLLEALDGLDPLELLAQDPNLKMLMQDIQNDPHNFSEVAPVIPVYSRVEWPSITPTVKASTSARQPMQVGPIKKRTKKPKDRSLNNHQCSVCNGPSKGYKYYGTVACISCRAFFSRAVKDEAYKGFICQGLTPQTGCSIDSKSWSSCQLCRFNQCLYAGMVIPTKEKRRKKKESVVDYDKQDEMARGAEGLNAIDQIVQRVKLFLQPSALITNEEKMKVEQYSKYPMDVSTKVVTNLCRSNMDLFLKMMEFIFYGEIYSFQTKKDVEDYINFYGTEAYISYNGPLADCVKPSDRLRLASRNFPILMEYFMASKLGNRLDDDYDMESYMAAIIRDEDEDFTRQVKNIYSKVSKNGTLKPVTLTYEMTYKNELFSLNSIEAIGKHRSAVMKLSQKNFGLEWDPIISLLTSCIILTTPDFIDLDEPKRVEEAQTTYASLLHRYLRSQNYANPEVVFRESMLASSYARELTEMKTSLYHRLKL